MEKTMRRFTLLLVAALFGGTDRLAAQETVETRGITSEVKIEEVIFGHLPELNGKFKIRATELTFAPDGYVGVHHHIGPGIRYVISGELTFAEGAQETVYKAGEYYFETGNLAHTAQNKTNLPLRVFVVEILPKDWTPPAMISAPGLRFGRYRRRLGTYRYRCSRGILRQRPPHHHSSRSRRYPRNCGRASSFASVLPPSD